jgi:hypothetical protein
MLIGLGLESKANRRMSGAQRSSGARIIESIKPEAIARYAEIDYEPGRAAHLGSNSLENTICMFTGRMTWDE